jgi:NAD-dependent deacetylase
MTTLYVTGAGVSADSGIPTFRGEDGYWTIGSVNYTPQEMATRQMYESDPGQFLLWYYRRFAAYRHVPPNDVHRWLAGECNAAAPGGTPRARLITQNIDGLDGRAGNADYVCIHGRLDMMTLYDDQMALHGRAQAAAAMQDDVMTGGVVVPAPWDDVPDALRRIGAASDDPASASDDEMMAALLALCRIGGDVGGLAGGVAGAGGIASEGGADGSGAPRPVRGVSLKPYVLLFDEYYTDLYRMGTAEDWMQAASRMVFIGTSFSVNITAIALRSAIQRGIPVEIVDPEPVDLGIPDGMADITYHRMTAQEWVG